MSLSPLTGFIGFASPEEVLAMGGPGPSESGRAALAGTLPFAAPGAPQQASGVAETSRGATAPPDLPTTVGEMLGDGLTRRGVPELLAVLEADASTPLEIFLAASEEDLTHALAATTVEGVALTAMGRAGVVQALRKLFTDSGFEPPKLGTVSRQALPVQAAALPPAAAPPAPARHAHELDGELVSLAQYADQASRQYARRLTYDELRAYRASYVAVCGAPPPEEYAPSAEQLAALRHLLATDRAPYVDFAVWSPLGPRLAKFRRTEAAVLIGGAFVTKPLEAPPTYEAWHESFQLFTVAMVTLGAATPASMQTYGLGIRKLLHFFPGRWGAIAAQDLVVRSERWGRMRENLAIMSPSVPSAFAWDRIIASSAFGVGSESDSWWNVNLVLPLTVHAPLAHAGLPGHSSSGGASSSQGPARSEKRRAGRAAGDRGGDTRTQPAAKVYRPDVSKEVCTLFNLRASPCDGDRPCPRGRRHECAVCGGAHPAISQHPDYKDNRKGGGKGKGRPKDKR
jgi:hypothetical protein